MITTSATTIQAELDKIHALLVKETEPSRYEHLYSAQQALAWVMNTEAAGAPTKVITEGKVYAPETLPLNDGPPLPAGM